MLAGAAVLPIWVQTELVVLVAVATPLGVKMVRLVIQIQAVAVAVVVNMVQAVGMAATAAPAS